MGVEKGRLDFSLRTSFGAGGCGEGCVGTGGIRHAACKCLTSVRRSEWKGWMEAWMVGWLGWMEAWMVGWLDGWRHGEPAGGPSVKCAETQRASSSWGTQPTAGR